MAGDSREGWAQVFHNADVELAYQLELVNIRASGWAMGRNEQEVEREAKRRLKESRGMEYPERRRS